MAVVPGPMHDDSTLEDLRTQAVLDISEHTSTLTPGLGREMAETFRELITDNRQQPQRMWKGLLTQKQMDALFTKHNVTPSTPSSASIVSSFKHMQHILACCIIDVRTKLTSYFYPQSASPQSPLEVTPKQAAVIAARRGQPHITTFFKPNNNTDQPLPLATRHRLAHKTIRTFTTYARSSRTPLIRIIPPYTPFVPTNPILDITPASTSTVQASNLDLHCLTSTARPARAPAPVHSKTRSRGLYTHTDPEWGYQGPLQEPHSTVEGAGLDGD